MGLETRSLMIERLDTVAKVHTNRVLISRARVVLLFATPFLVLIAVANTASQRGTLLISIVATAAVVTTVVLWLEWRYEVYVLAVLCLTMSASNALLDDHPASRTLLNWFGSHSFALLFLYWTCALLLIAGRYAKVGGNEWRSERDQLNAWLETVNGERPPDVVEFSSGSFWTGYWTYRIYNPGGCWLIARFKKGSTKLVDCRVCDLANVVFRRASSGKWNIDIIANGKRKSFMEVELSGQLPPAFVR